MKDIKLTMNSKRLIVLNISFAAVLLYILALRTAYPIFQNIQVSEPMASLQALFPLFYIAVLVMTAAVILNVIFSLECRALNAWLLVIFGIMLWYTPHILAGTTYQLDGLRNINVGEYMPQVFQGQNVIGNVVTYGRQYPASFVFDWIMINAAGLPANIFLNIVFPLLALVLFLILAYLVLEKLFNDRIAFISLLLAIPGMHYIQIYASPHALGTLLIMLALFFIIRKDYAGMILACTVIIAAVYAHPISPLILLIFMGSFLVSTLVKERSGWQIGLAAATVFCFGLWFLLFTSRINITPGAISLTEPSSPVAVITNATNSDFFNRTLSYLFGPAFIFGWVYSLARDIYFAYAGIVIVLLVISLALNYRDMKQPWKWLVNLGGLHQHQVFFVLSAILLLLLTLLLGAYNMTGYDLVERSLTFLILAISAVIASLLFGRKTYFPPKTGYAVFSVLFIILSITFPLVSYTKDAYTSMPLSEKKGLDYIYENRLLPYKTVDGREFIVPRYQIAHSTTFNSIPGDPPSTYIFKMTAYYYASMRLDISFIDNRFIKSHESISVDPRYDCVYVNRTTTVYQLRQ